MLLQTEISEAQLKGFPLTRGVEFVKGSNTGAESRRDQSAHALYRGTDGVHIGSRISTIRSLAREMASG